MTAWLSQALSSILPEDSYDEESGEAEGDEDSLGDLLSFDWARKVWATSLDDHLANAENQARASMAAILPWVSVGTKHLNASAAVRPARVFFGPKA